MRITAKSAGVRGRDREGRVASRGRREAAAGRIAREPASSGRAAYRAGVDADEVIPRDADEIELELSGKRLKLTNLRKLYWLEEGITKGDLLRYYATVSAALLPHLRGRPMVMKRYPDGAGGPFFFMKRTPPYRPAWLRTCAVEHASGSIIDFPVIDDLPSLLWTVNLGCIDLNPWYARCDDVHRPDFLHFDLDPVKPRRGEAEVPFARVLEAALILRDALNELGMPCYAKTTGSRGVHVYVPIERGPTQEEVWGVAKAISHTLAPRHPELLTAVYAVARRPAGRVLLDYNQNAWGRTLASVYSIRPRPRATASAPVTWKEIERGVAVDDFRLDNLPARLARVGDPWAPLLASGGRFKLGRLM